MGDMLSDMSSADLGGDVSVDLTDPSFSDPSAYSFDPSSVETIGATDLANVDTTNQLQISSGGFLSDLSAGLGIGTAALSFGDALKNLFGGAPSGGSAQGSNIHTSSGPGLSSSGLARGPNWALLAVIGVAAIGTAALLLRPKKGARA